jgi:hypothetical protein
MKQDRGRQRPLLREAARMDDQARANIPDPAQVARTP